MLGAMAGDIIGSVYEARPIKSKAFPLFHAAARFTDDTVCTIAVADAVLSGADIAATLRKWVRRYPGAGYGGMFLQWARIEGMGAYGSWGNGAAMRVSPAGWLGRDESDVLALAAASAAVSHDHPKAVAAAKATALAIWLARIGTDREQIRRRITADFSYDLTSTVDEIRPGYAFDVSSEGTVPPALVSAFEATDYEDAVRNAISLGGDSDTLACIAGCVAEALYGLPDPIAEEARRRLPADMLGVLQRFETATAKLGI